MVSTWIRSEEPNDYAIIRHINCTAFGRDHEARLVDRLRADGLVVASLVAVADNDLVGHILFSDLSITSSNGHIEAVALAPIAVLPKHQRRGIGTSLVREGLRFCRERGKQAAFVLGDPAYYGRFGFSVDLTSGIESSYRGDHWMASELVEGALSAVTGSVSYPAAFATVE